MKGRSSGHESDPCVEFCFSLLTDSGVGSLPRAFSRYGEELYRNQVVTYSAVCTCSLSVSLRSEVGMGLFPCSSSEAEGEGEGVYVPHATLNIPPLVHVLYE